MSSFEIRRTTAHEFSIVIDWASEEGWNPGLEDLPPFLSTDPDGFMMGFIDDEPISAISVVRYGSDFGFLGFYIVRPKYRGKGYGLATWNTGLQHLGHRIIGLDGVIDQQHNYRKNGFELMGRNIRHKGIPNLSKKATSEINIKNVESADLQNVLEFDRNFFEAPRDSFTKAWINPDLCNSRRTKIAVQDGNIIGYATLRECRNGYKIGPLFAEDEAIADALFVSLVKSVPEGSEISLDTPEKNLSAVNLATGHDLKPVFETARMYKGKAPPLPLQKIFGVTTFELG